MLSATRPLIPVLVATMALLLAGCEGGTDGTDGRRAVASFYPLAWVTERVAGDDWSVSNLTTPGGEPHDVELGIAATAATEEADLVVYERGLQPAVDDTVDSVAGGEVVDVAEEVELMPLAEDEHADEHGGDDHGAVDPHFWHDPLLMADLADTVADRLADLDPDGAQTYRANADRLRTELEELDRAYERGLASCERDTVVVSHDAFGYLGRYGLRFESIAGLSPDAEPTPAVVARLQRLIRTEGITTVFSERLTSPAMAQTLARDTGVETAVLDPIEGVADADAEADYLSLMHDNLDALESANGC